MGDLQSKVEALKELVAWRKSGAVRCSSVEKLEAEIFKLSEQVIKYPTTNEQE